MKPSAQQISAAIKLVKKDCHLQGEYVNDHNETCAVGCLGLAAGVSKRYLANHNADAVEYLPRLIRAIRKKFGIDGETLDKIQDANDSTHLLYYRRTRIVKLIRKLLEPEET